MTPGGGLGRNDIYIYCTRTAYHFFPNFAIFCYIKKVNLRSGREAGVLGKCYNITPFVMIDIRLIYLIRYLKKYLKNPTNEKVVCWEEG